MKRPDWWTPMHARAKAALSPEWQALTALRKVVDHVVAFDELVVGKIAEVRREPITRNGTAAGERTYYRLAA